MKNASHSFLSHRILILVMALSLLACKKESMRLPIVSTGLPFNIEYTTATLGGQVTNEGGSAIITQGVCWSTSMNPSISDFTAATSSTGIGDYLVNATGLDTNTVYHCRAFATNSAGIGYGEDLTFSTRNFVNFLTTLSFNLEVAQASVSGGLGPSSVDVDSKGFVIATSPAQSIDDATSVEIEGPLQMNYTFTGLLAETQYFVKPYAIYNGELSYGEEVNFRTVGQIGPSGGFVLYDRGNDDSSWRYLEARVGTVQQNTWGCEGEFIGDTGTQYGDGLANTFSIVNNCTESSFAAKACSELISGGSADWFLPSVKELESVFRGFESINPDIILAETLMSSSESDASEAIHVSYDGNNYGTIQIAKGTQAFYLPVRRY